MHFLLRKMFGQHILQMRLSRIFFQSNFLFLRQGMCHLLFLVSKLTISRNFFFNYLIGEQCGYVTTFYFFVRFFSSLMVCLNQFFSGLTKSHIVFLIARFMRLLLFSKCVMILLTVIFPTTGAKWKFTGLPFVPFSAALVES